MGCNNSRHILEMESRPIRPVTLSSHSVGSVMAPSSIFQDFPETSELSRQQIIDAFQHMAEYLNECGTYVKCAVVGGVVNALYLRHRETTPDVEFLLQRSCLERVYHAQQCCQFRQQEGTRNSRRA